MMTDAIPRRIAAIKDRLSAILSRKPEFSADPATHSFCRMRLQWLADSRAIDTAAEHALSGTSGYTAEQVLIIDEGDNPLTTAELIIAAYITGTALRIKTRNHCDWLNMLCGQPGTDSVTCEFAGPEQHDTALLHSADTVVVTGSNALIRHWRKITPPPVRLIENGPKISAMIICGTDLPAPELILWDTCLFLREVNDSPRFILLDSPMMAERLYSSLSQVLNELPCLPQHTRLHQMVKARELSLRHVLAPDLRPPVYSTASGWGLTLRRTFEPAHWLPYGFNLITGDPAEHLKMAARYRPGQLQTLGCYGRQDLLPLRASRFSRHCDCGQMHNPPFSFSALITPVQNDIRLR
ncbi:hypothetical protein RN616_02990 [Morganella morganii]|uniref:hypothetical protein n=1 Tax=Morganella morganii TaxID=582 RepID=UPI0028D0D050|nr:hypothetical protein [Morganella morganii]WNP31205.1 hypothetical protein RN616_02990 [Morganella morganii]